MFFKHLAAILQREYSRILLDEYIVPEEGLGLPELLRLRLGEHEWRWKESKLVGIN